METHPLNKAHQQHRRAEAHLKNNKYDDAMQCHHNAAELLLDAMKSTSSSVALESITLQHSYHLKQKDLIQSKKEQYIRVKKAMDIFKNMSKDSQVNVPGEPSKVQVAIYKNLNDSETLLYELSSNQDAGEIKDLAKLNEGKAEKSQKIVIEELQTLNHSLHSLVEQLVLQVEVLKDENMTLKERVNFLEKERVRYLNISQDEITLSDEPTRDN
ncbi:nuclear receptor-binding factor 2-like [Pieris rapae]|uniref:nuclear receptor-binding factor 2-like n=1 Tax=Pieris rapae TaxID=64459 RepID=UPI001E27FD06|nr:nuclear receptor-binding factor 2-like [Pieris rapae]